MDEQTREVETSQALDQYKEFCETCRYYDAKFWSFPATAFTFEAAALQFLFDKPRSGWTPLIVSCLLSVLFFGFTYQLARFRSYQIITEANARSLIHEYFPHLKSFTQFTGLGKLSSEYHAPWFSRILGFSSTSYMISFMLAVEIVNLAMVYLFARRLYDPTFLASVWGS
jgi:hypothetical protein